jgi:DNA repair protein RadC
MGATKRSLKTEAIPNGEGEGMEGNWKAYELSIVRNWASEVTVRIERPAEIFTYFMEDARLYSQEALWVALLDGRNNLVGITQVYKGTATGTSVCVADLLRPALLTGAVGFIMIHNHPSGDPVSSNEDLRLTTDVLSASRLMDIEMLDHIVVAGTQFSSIRSENPSMWAQYERQEASV